MDKKWTISNILSLSRIVLMIPAVYFLAASVPFHREIAVLIMLLAVITDALDGYLARLYNEISELGKIIDPLADKISIGIVVVMLVIFGDIPLWFALVVLGRDVIIFLAGLYLKARVGIILPSILSGKVTVAFVALYLILSILQYEYFRVVLAPLQWLCIVLMGYSFTLYANRFLKTLYPVKK
jgi:CDP-diacylglycerol--glycerol-3-phosphate 3-phosphatidyltransferase